jgi:hypothetical protein
MAPGGTVCTTAADGGGNLESATVCEMQGSALRPVKVRLRREREGERLGRSARGAGHRFPDGIEIARHFALKDPEIVQRGLGECVGRYTKIFGEDGRRRMGKPVGHQERVELAGVAGVEADNEFATVRPEALQGMRVAGGKIPDVAFLDVRNIGAPHRIQHGDPAVTRMKWQPN